MKISDLNDFSFHIGNPLGKEEVDVVATNKGIVIDGKLDGNYNDNDIIDAYDLCDTIDNAIKNCSTLTEEDKEELGTYLGADYDIECWWEENIKKISKDGE